MQAIATSRPGHPGATSQRDARAPAPSDGPARARRRPRAGRVGRGPSPGRARSSRRPPRVADRARSRPTSRRPSSSTARTATARCAPRRRSRRSATRTSVNVAGGYHRLEARRLSDHRLRSTLDPGAAPSLQPPPADPRDRRGGPAEAARLAHAADRRRRPRLPGRRSTWPRPGSGRSGSSTPTSSTSRTCSARSSTRPRALGQPEGRVGARAHRSRRSTRT